MWSANQRAYPVYYYMQIMGQAIVWKSGAGVLDTYMRAYYL